MGRHSSSTAIYDGFHTLSISTFTKQGIFDYPKEIRKATLNFAGYKIPFEIRHARLLRFDYLLNGKPCTYNILISESESNLPNNEGTVRYFFCPLTGKRALKLYFYGGKFMHRTAIKGLYRSQTESHFSRAISKILGKPMELENLYKELYSPYRKRHYKGKPTPLARKIEQIENRIPSLQEQIECERMLFSK
jgi:hypothetical protein